MSSDVESSACLVVVAHEAIVASQKLRAISSMVHTAAFFRGKYAHHPYARLTSSSSSLIRPKSASRSTSQILQNQTYTQFDARFQRQRSRGVRRHKNSLSQRARPRTLSEPYKNLRGQCPRVCSDFINRSSSAYASCPCDIRSTCPSACVRRLPWTSAMDAFRPGKRTHTVPRT